MLSTLFGSEIFVRFEHPANAVSPMLFTPFVIVTLERLLQSAKVCFPMLSTEPGTTADVMPLS